MKVVLITGSTSGIGLGIAREFAKIGYAIAFNGLEVNGKAIAEAVAQEFNIQTKFYPANLQFPEQITEMVKEVEVDFGKIDVASSSTLQINLTKWLIINHTMILNHDNDHNAPIARDIITNTGTSIVNTGSKIQISNVIYLAVNINFDLIKKKK